MATKTKTTYKRKNESSDAKIEPAMKALKKNDIIIQFKALQNRYDALEEQNRILLQEKSNHTEAIILLEETVSILEIRCSKVDQTSVEVQTEIIRCEECDFPAESMNDLV